RAFSFAARAFSFAAWSFCFAARAFSFARCLAACAADCLAAALLATCFFAVDFFAAAGLVFLDVLRAVDTLGFALVLAPALAFAFSASALRSGTFFTVLVFLTGAAGFLAVRPESLATADFPVRADVLFVLALEAAFFTAVLVFFLDA